MIKKLVWISVLASSLTMSQMALAHSSACREGLSKMVQSLNLDETQKAKVKPILEQLKTDLQTAGSKMNDIETQIDQQVSSANMDQSKVDKLVDDKAQLIGDKIKAKLKAKNQIFVLLNSQQKQKLQEKIKASNDKMAAEYKNCDED